MGSAARIKLIRRRTLLAQDTGRQNISATSQSSRP